MKSERSSSEMSDEGTDHCLSDSLFLPSPQEPYD